MRTELQPLEGRRTMFVATFVRNTFVKTNGGIRRKVLLKHVKDLQGRLMALHISITNGSDVRVFDGFDEGELLQFSATVRMYVKGYRGEDIDLKLQHPIRLDYELVDIQDLKSLCCHSNREHNITSSPAHISNDKERIFLGVM
jgi:hypothetical protein